MPTLNVTTVTIPNGAAGLSAAIFLGNAIPLSIQMPATWVAADLGFEVSMDGVSYVPLYDSGGNEVSAVAVQGTGVNLSGADFGGWQYLKFRSGLFGAAVDQTADRTLLVGMRQTAR